VRIVDGSVVHQRDPPCHVAIRVRVLVRLAAVGRPAGVRDAHLVARVLARFLAQQLDGVGGVAAARVLGDGNVVRGAESRQASRVVAAVAEHLDPTKHSTKRWREKKTRSVRTYNVFVNLKNME